MLRKIVHIDPERCIGCGLCVRACHEGAIAIVDGKAKLLRDDYCDGLGNCLPACPMDAIRIEEREAVAYNREVAPKRVGEKDGNACSCPGSQAKSIEQNETGDLLQDVPSRLGQWPCQIKLVPINAPYFEQADVLIAADCSAYAYGNFHQQFMKGKITLIGCPKLDEVDYADKLTAILATNNIKSVTVVRMEVPCCGGLENAVKRALVNSRKQIHWEIVTISTKGDILQP